MSSVLKVGIIIDGALYEWKSETISFDDILRLSREKNDERKYLISYDKGAGEAHGILSPGSNLKVKAGMKIRINKLT